jgi:hypothetical protein
MLPVEEDDMVVATHALGISGTILCGFASFLLAKRFGITFKDNDAVVYQPGKCLKFLKLNTIERGARVSYTLLGIGFILLLAAQILSCLI